MNKIKKMIAAVLVVAALCMLCAFKIPKGVNVTGYEENVDYMDKIVTCVREGTDAALSMGAIYEAQRNLKIQENGMSYGQTDFFSNTTTAKEVAQNVDAYLKAGQKAPSSNAQMEQGITYYFTENDVVMCAKVLWAECRGIPSQVEKACVVWTILNRVDSASFPNTIASVITQPNQFAYSSGNPVWQDLYNLAYDVLTRWNLEKNGQSGVGRVLPSNYFWYNGDGRHNHFRNTYKITGYYWDYSLPSPY